MPCLTSRERLDATILTLTTRVSYAAWAAFWPRLVCRSAQCLTATCIEWRKPFSRLCYSARRTGYNFTRSPDAADLSMAAMTSWRRTASAKSGTV